MPSRIMNKIKLPGLTHFGKFDWLPISTICSTTNPIFWHQLFPSIQWDLKSWKFCTLWSWMTFLPKKMNIDCDQDHKGYCMLIYYNIKHFEEDVKYYVHMLLWQIRIVQFNLFGLYIASQYECYHRYWNKYASYQPLTYNTWNEKWCQLLKD